jgi:hypothetical protein
LYSRGREGVPNRTLGQASTYVSVQLGEYMEKNMSELATKPEIGFSASIYNAKGEKMMTYHLKARMANTVRFPRSCWGADFYKSEVSKETLGQQISRKRRAKRGGGTFLLLDHLLKQRCVLKRIRLMNRPISVWRMSLRKMRRKWSSGSRQETTMMYWTTR